MFWPPADRRLSCTDLQKNPKVLLILRIGQRGIGVDEGNSIPKLFFCGILLVLGTWNATHTSTNCFVLKSLREPLLATNGAQHLQKCHFDHMGIGRDLVIDDVRGILTEAAHQTQRDVDSRMEELQCPLLSIRLFFHDELKAACISQSVPWSDTSGQKRPNSNSHP